MRAAALAALLMLGSATSAVAADQFDLVCSGTTTLTGRAPEKWDQRISVDLQDGTFCPEGCTVILKIAKLEPGQIVFWDDAGGWPNGPDQTYFAVSRTDGSVDRLRTSNLGFEKTDARCAVAPFTPMPKTLF